MDTVSLLMLTHNKKKTIELASLPTIEFAGYPINELIWVDNGSTEENWRLLEIIKPDIFIFRKENLGVAKGTNLGLEVATSSWVVCPGSDMLMPRGWLQRMMEYTREFPEFSVFSTLFNLAPDHYNKILKERRLGDDIVRAELTLTPGICIGPMIVKKEVYDKVGYLREDIGMYGYEDVLWDEAMRKAKFKGGIIQEIVPIHMTEYEDEAYLKWKAEEVKKAEAVLRSKK